MTSLRTAFSSDGVDVICRQVQSNLSLGKDTSKNLRASEHQLKSYYETERCCKYIIENDYQRVALQFPDSLMSDSSRVATILTQETTKEICILGDTSYGSCCVDEIAAEHYLADSIIHFGPSCLTRTRRLPVLYIFGREEIDLVDCKRAFKETFPASDAHVLVLYDTVYSHCIDELTHCLTDYNNCVVSKLSLPSGKSHAPSPNQRSCQCSSESTNNQTHSDGEEQVCCRQRSAVVRRESEASNPTPIKGVSGERTGNSESESSSLCAESRENGLSAESSKCIVYDRFGRCFQLLSPIENYKVFYIGLEGSTLTNLILNYNKSQFYSYNPITRLKRQETLNVNRTLGRRYFLVQKAKEARTVGILVGTLGAANYLEIIQRLKAVLLRAGKKYYTIAVGKLNAPKMANFLEIDLYVLVACPENSLVDSQEFFKPVVTPYEMEIACLRSKEWTGEYSTDYQELFPGAAFYSSLDESDGVELSPEFSLITGGFVPTGESSQSEKSHATSSAVVPRSHMEMEVHNTAAAYLHKRSWQGLEQKLGETEVEVAVKGRTGIPIGYTHEQEQ